MISLSCVKWHKVPSHLRLIRAVLAVESMEVGTYHFTWGPKSMSPKYDMDAYMATFFWEVRLETCGEGWAEQKARLNSQHKSCIYFCINK
jgi:hypothetical protein